MTDAMAGAVAEYRRRRRLGEWPRDALEAMMDAFALEPVFTDAERSVRQLFGQLLVAEARGHARRWRSRCVHLGIRWQVDAWPLGRCTGCGESMVAATLYRRGPVVQTRARPQSASRRRHRWGVLVYGGELASSDEQQSQGGYETPFPMRRTWGVLPLTGQGV